MSEKLVSKAVVENGDKLDVQSCAGGKCGYVWDGS